MNNAHDIKSDETCRELRLQSQLLKCVGSCGNNALDWLVIGALIPSITLPYLAKRELVRYLSFESRFLVAAVSGLLLSFSMGYRSKVKCEENVIKLFAEHREEELEEKKVFTKITPLRRFLRHFT